VLTPTFYHKVSSLFTGKTVIIQFKNGISPQQLGIEGIILKVRPTTARL